MNPKASSLLFLALFFAISTTSTAINITKILEGYSEFSTFNQLLNQTHLTDQINHRQTITVLAVDNAAISVISGRPLDEIKRLLSIHIILDYYDTHKLNKLATDKGSLLTTLYQTTGVAQGRQGFLNVTHTSSGETWFGSAVKDAGLSSKLVEPVMSQPYNISVLHVTGPIYAPGLTNFNYKPPPPAAPTPKKAPAPAEVEAPEPSEDEAEAPEAEAPEAEAPADAPESDAPASPEKHSAAADEAPAPKSDSSRVGTSFAVAAVMGMVLSFVGF